MNLKQLISGQQERNRQLMKGHFGEHAECSWLNEATTDSFNAGALAVIGEVIELVNSHDPMANKKSNPNYWGNTLRKDFTTLEQSLQAKQ